MLGTKKMTSPPSHLDILDHVKETAMVNGDHPS
jgi:hypothetical protein